MRNEPPASTSGRPVAFPTAHSPHIGRGAADSPGMHAPMPTSRAVVRYIEAGSSVTCAHCTRAVQFRARIRPQQVICNVYDDGAWIRVEHYHRDCYDEAASPYGTPDDSQPMRPRMRAQPAATPTSEAEAAESAAA